MSIGQNYKKYYGTGLIFGLQTMCNDHVQFLQKLLNVSDISTKNILFPHYVKEIAKSGFYTHEKICSYENKRLMYMINDGFKYDFYKIVNLYLANLLFLHSKCFENGNYVTPSERKNLIDNGLIMFISDEGNQISEVDDILQNKLKNLGKL